MSGGPYQDGDRVLIRNIFRTRLTRGTIAASSNLLELEDPVGYANADTVVVQGAGPAGSRLVTTISALAGRIATLQDEAATGVTNAKVGKATHPTAATLRVKKPISGTVTPYTGGQITVTGFVYEVGVVVDEHGRWHYRWEGTGPAEGVDEGGFQVNHSRFA